MVEPVAMMKLIKKSWDEERKVSLSVSDDVESLLARYCKEETNNV